MIWLKREHMWEFRQKRFQTDMDLGDKGCIKKDFTKNT